MTDPIPVSGYGVANWTDYNSYWRDVDTDFLQERAVLRYATTAARNAAWGAAPTRWGQVIYNQETDRLEVASKTSTWVTVPQWAYLGSGTDSTTTVNISHKTSNPSFKGINIAPAAVSIDTPTVNLAGTTLKIEDTSVAGGALTFKTGGKTVVFKTDATSLTIDSPVSVTGAVTSTGALTGTTLTLSGALSGVSNITMTGTLTGATSITATAGTIGGVGLGTAAVGGANLANASGGFQSQTGMFNGDGTSAYVRQRAINGGAMGSASLQVTATDAYLGGSNVWIAASTYFRIQGGKGIPWHNAGGTHQAWISPTIVYAGDPGAANFPDGTILIQP